MAVPADPFFSGAVGCQGGPDRHGIDQLGVQIDENVSSQTKMKVAQHLLERAVITLLPETLVNGLPRPETFWKIPPFGTRAQYPEDPIKHLTIIASWPPIR
nr:hypothetical protein [Pseudomonas syringae]